MQESSINYTAASKSYRFPRTDIKCFHDDGIFQREVMEAKRYKILGHHFLDEDILIWTDANITMKISNQEAIKKFLGDSDLMIFKHPKRNCIYKEFAELRKCKRLNDEWLQKNLKEQELYYRKKGMPTEFGLWECNFIIRRNTPIINNLFNDWWAEICRWQWRDQVSLPYLLWKNKHIKFKSFDGNDIRNRNEFEYKWHY